MSNPLTFPDNHDQGGSNSDRHALLKGTAALRHIELRSHRFRSNEFRSNGT